MVLILDMKSILYVLIIHMIRVDVESTFELIIGSKLQCEELIDYITKDSYSDLINIQKSEIFGRSLDEIVKEGIQAKLSLTPENARFKLQNTLTKLVNKGGGNLFTLCNITLQLYFF